MPPPPGNQGFPPQGYAPGQTGTGKSSKGLQIGALIASIAGLIVWYIAPIVGIILGFVALNRAKKAGEKSGLAVAAIVVGFIVLLLNILFTVGIVSLITYSVGLAELCATYGDGAPLEDGGTLDCSAFQ